MGTVGTPSSEVRHGRGINRRQAIASGGAVLMGAAATPLVASCSSKSKNSGGKITGELDIEVGSYYPAPATDSDPNPPTMIKTIISEYQEKHSDVKINLVQAPDTVSGDTWRTTVFQGGTEPHIITNNYIRVWQEAVNDWYVPLNDYITKPNSYVPSGKPGHDQWKDEIPDYVWETTVDSKGNQYLITTDGVVAGMFFNKKIFSQLGLPTELKYENVSIWKDWEDMLGSLDTLKGAKYQAVALSMNEAAPFSYNWVDGIALTSTFYDRLQEMGEPASPTDKKWHALSQKEFAEAVKKGTFSATDPRYGAWLDLMTKYQQYWASGYTSATADEDQSLFVNQKAPIWIAVLSSSLKNLKQVAKFDFGVTQFPVINGTTTSYASKVTTPWLTGGPTSGWTVTKRAKTEGKVELAVDFLQYMTAQPQWSRMVTDAQTTVPYVKGLSVPGVLAQLPPFLKTPIRAFKDPDPRVTKQYGVQHRKLMQQYFTKQIDRKKLVQSEQSLLESQTAQVLQGG